MRLGVTPRVAVVIVTYNSAEVLGACLSALPDDVSEVVVADNNSKDATVGHRQGDVARVVQVGRNAGYAAGINAGLPRWATSPTSW